MNFAGVTVWTAASGQAGAAEGRILPTLLSAGTDVSEEMAIGEQLLRAAPQSLLDFLTRVVLCIVTFLVGVKVISLIRKLIGKAMERTGAAGQAGQFVDSCVRVVLYVILVFQIAMHLGINAATIATVLGSATVTVGLAFQGSLKNCIGGIMIMILHPFRVGDYIIETTYESEGTVSEITVFYTKLATLDNRTIILPNGQLADAGITNVTREENRRVELKVGISYEADIRRAKGVLEGLLLKEEGICRDLEYNIFVDELGASAVVLGIRFWTKTENYWPVRWKMLEEIKYAFDDNGIGIPYPQMDVHVKRMEEKEEISCKTSGETL
ncbi:MAG TPA: mechanosensitive ion channel [Candidatus Eisenbergiella stercorigallinarum]|uniref:Mechanosensitive ion channel n=1 Tax=Candidatus Eisenbergiella stercorigallinarum TaxID=2838557 RepID=A0A9D2QWE8_9FIRM|nr:mechanosensitive ion channel [Candidatus Eisenbergiella stercorigallinarum]